MRLPSGLPAARIIRSAAVTALLALYYFMAVSAASQKSMTFDEMAHLTAGYTYWAFNDYRLHPENGNWPQRLAALPAVLGGSSFPRLDQPAWTTSSVYAIGDQFLYSSGNDADTMVRRARRLMALLGVALGALVYAWARRLISATGGWIALLLFVFSPTMLAHGPLVTSDMAAALFFTAAAGGMWMALHRVTPATVLGGGVLLAGGFLSKLSGPLLIPIGIVMLSVRLIGGRPLTVAFAGRKIEYRSRVQQFAVLVSVAVVFGLVAWVLVWASFGFRYTAFSAATTGRDTFLGKVAEQPGVMGVALAAARRFHLLPEAYVYGTGLTVQFASERAAFLNGQYGTKGWWWYFPYAFAVKTTIPALMIGVLALAALASRWTSGDAAASWLHRAQISLYEGAPLLAILLVYWAFALTTNLNIGHRHLLPTYPALCILAGGSAFWIEPLLKRTRGPERQTGRQRRKFKADAGAQGAASGSRKAAGIATIVLLGWHGVESAAIRPDYLAYFNQLAGGPAQGYKHLADSSLDWGQDLPALKRWLDAAGLQESDGAGVYLSYFGTARPEYYGIHATALAGFIDRRAPQPPAPLRAGVYCISATMLDVVGRSFYKPDQESNYQAAVKNLTIFARASENEQAWAALMQQTGQGYWQQLFAQFDQMRTGRLIAFLRHREPDAMVGYSILIYRLTEADVALAVSGPAPGDPAAQH
jgi:hypothetical protein